MQKDDLEKKILTVIPNEQAEGSPFYILYFPQGEFGPQNYFQSVVLNYVAYPRLVHVFFHIKIFQNRKYLFFVQ